MKDNNQKKLLEQSVSSLKVKLNMTAEKFLARHHIKTVAELLKTSTALEPSRTWNSLAPLRNKLSELGFKSDSHYFTIVPI